MKKTKIAFNTNCYGQIDIHDNRIVTAESVGQWATGQMVWEDEEENQYTLHRHDGIEYFVLEAVNPYETTWK